VWFESVMVDMGGELGWTNVGEWFGTWGGLASALYKEKKRRKVASRQTNRSVISGKRGSWLSWILCLLLSAW
jgi:hypothetical protein